MSSSLCECLLNITDNLKMRYPDILPKDILPKDILPNGHFTDGQFDEQSVCRMDFLPKRLLAEKTSCRKDFLPKRHFENGRIFLSSFS